MTKAELFTQIVKYRNNEITQRQMLDAVDAVFNSQHDGKPIISGSLPLRLETCKNGQSIVDANLNGVIVATANKSEWADEIVRRWNMVTDAGSGNNR